MNERFSPPFNSEKEPRVNGVEEHSISDPNLGNSKNNSSNREKPSRLEYGESFFRELSGVPEDYHVSAEHKLLFSTICNDPDNSNFPVLHDDTATFTTFGLEYNGGRLPFLPEYQSLIHQTVLKKYLAESASADDFYSRLNNENHNWQTAIEDYIYDNFFEDFKRPFDEEKMQQWEIRKELINEQNSTKRRREKQEQKNYRDERKVDEHYTEDLHQYLLENNILTPQEIKDYEYKKNTIYRICVDFGREIEDFYNSGNAEDSEIKKSYAKEASEKLKIYLEEVAREEVESIEKNPEVSFKESTISKLKKKIPSISERINADNQRGGVFEFVKSHYDIDDNELHNIIKRAKDRCINYFSHLAPEYIDAYDEFYNSNSEEINSITKQYHGASGKEYRESREEEWLNEKMQPIIEKIKVSAKSVAFSDLGDEVKEMFFFPTGIVVRTESGLPKSAIISPIDKRILKGIDDPEVENVWKDFWRTKQADYDNIARGVIETDLKRNLYRSMDGVDQEIATFTKELDERDQIKVQKIFDPLTGHIYGGIQPDDISILESLSSNFGNFIYGIDFGLPKKETSLKSTRLEILDFLSGRSSGENLLLVEKNQRLNIDFVKELLNNAGPEKHDKAYSRIASELGIALYNQLPDSKRIIYRDIIGNSVNVSRANFYKAYRENIVDPDKRRRITERTLFLRDFIDYTKGETNPVITKFFDGLKKNLAINQ